MKKTFAALAVLGLLAACSSNADPAKVAKTAKGDTLVDSKGMTLYTFDKDSDGKSACNGPCATSWLPLSASAEAKPTGSYTVVGRDDGGKQWAYKGKPLYTYTKDKSAGDITGDGFLDGAWHVAQP
jgi:predicted lipoprotein with Yx(FWY)xxD motif